MSSDSSVGVAMGYWLEDRSSPLGSSRKFSLLHGVHTGSGAYPASYPVDTRNFFPGIKCQGPEADHSPPSSAVKNSGSNLYSPHTSSWRGA
jgi:hypothetical protein